MAPSGRELLSGPTVCVHCTLTFICLSERRIWVLIFFLLFYEHGIGRISPNWDLSVFKNLLCIFHS